ncbi:MAG: DUF1801 domain-containing protein [Demequina sp.]|jgi:uncharacterized protein YdhG (YjbR/CyaY superfamily)|nr:DUF1801 domain-containing protein [Demequina sp.]
MGENFSEEEKAAMRETVAERQRSKKADAAAAEAEACAEKIAEMPDGDRAIAQKVHDLVTSAAPELAVSTWYGMPAYKLDGKVVVFFKPAEKFKSRYCTLGFEDAARVDDGTFWPTSYAVTAIGAAEEKAITALVKKAVAR